MTHTTGSFCFAELHTQDFDAAQRFYGTVLGWTVADAAAAGEATPRLFQRDGQTVAGVRRASGPSRWVPFIAVDSVDRVTTRAHELRASIVSAPADVDGVARTSIINDPAGGVVGLWEARGRNGADMLDRAGAMWWAELLTRDVHGAKGFYSNLLGWKPVDTLKYGIRYTVFKDGDSSIAGILPIGSDWGPVTPYWQVLFAVDNCDAAVERAKSAGGSLIFGPNDIPNAGRAAVLCDPRNAIFVVMQPNEPA